MEDDSDLQPLPLPPLLPRGSREPAAALPWSVRWVDGLTRSIPVLAMAAVAVGTTWLVRQVSRPDVEPSASAVRHVPDYEMSGFSMQRYTQDAAAPPSVIEGDEVRHFPDTDTLEIDRVRVRWIDAQGQVTLIRAARALLQDDRSHAVLEGDAVLTRLPLKPGEAELEFRGERLLFDNNSQHVSADRPVTLRQGDDVFDAARLDYDHKSGQLELFGGVKGRLPPRPRASAAKN
jgi:lipopolysaccharide export system protein LptC